MLICNPLTKMIHFLSLVCFQDQEPVPLQRAPLPQPLRPLQVHLSDSFIMSLSLFVSNFSAVQCGESQLTSWSWH